jgi:hypothetical protein
LKKAYRISPAKVLQVLSFDDQILKLAEKIFALFSESTKEDRNELASALLTAGVRSLTDLNLFQDVEALVKRILLMATAMNVNILLRKIITSVKAGDTKASGSSSGFLPQVPDATVATLKLAEAVRLMAKDNSKGRRNDGVRRGLPSDDEDEPVFDLAASLSVLPSGETSGRLVRGT